MGTRFSLKQRAAGILLHPTSLPGPHGGGDLGVEARRFADFLHAAGQTWWQMLPIGPVGLGNSPYASTSAFAGNPLLIDLDALVADGLLEKADVKPPAGRPTRRVDYARVTRFRMACLRRAFERFLNRRRGSDDFDRFCREQQCWLHKHALFCAVKRAHRDRPWTQWNPALRAPTAGALQAAFLALQYEILFETFVQYVFDRQWAALKRYCNERGVGLIGDLPIFVSHDSADVWAHQELFRLDARGRPLEVSGVPPDYFSRTGQLWGHPLYRWERHRATGYAWWIARFRRALEQFDAVRIDHFLGFNRCWAMSARAKTAAHGRWRRSPGRELLECVTKALGRMPIIAEDLGLVTPQATALREHFDYPGMRVLQFAFGDDARYGQPLECPRNCVVYAGTHDNDTTVGWFLSRPRGPKARGRDGLTEAERFLRCAGWRVAQPPSAVPGRAGSIAPSRGRLGHVIAWAMIRLAYASRANLAIVPMQDVLGLGSAARMNRPGKPRGNWEWRMAPDALTDELAAQLRALARTHGRIRAARTPIRRSRASLHPAIPAE